MIKKRLFARREEPAGKICYVTQYRIFGILLYETKIDDYVLNHAPQLA